MDFPEVGFKRRMHSGVTLGGFETKGKARGSTPLSTYWLWLCLAGITLYGWLRQSATAEPVCGREGDEDAEDGERR